jgi:hypothetical protein
MADQAADYPVYEKNGQTQIAATPAREVELKFDGWRKQEKAADKPASSGGDSPSDQPKPKSSK